MRFRVLSTLFFFQAFAFAAGGGGAAAIVFVADSRGLTGWRAWITNLYNENLFYFALFTVILIPSLAVVLGSITNFFLARSGINLKSRVLAEH
jgi:hypothetical protein